MKNEEKTTTYTASDLPENIHSEETARDAETVENAEPVENLETVKNTEMEPQDSTEAESGIVESEMVESAEDVEVTTSESEADETTAEPGVKETTKEEPSDEDSNEESEEEKVGFTRGKLIKIFAMEVLAFVIFIFAIIAWFSMNEATSATGMQIKVQAPDGIFISLGAKEKVDGTTIFYLKTSGTSVVEPTDSDWASEVEIDDYYTFGKMMPASSISGEDIYFTPDATAAGKKVKSEARYFQANGGYTDGHLKDFVATGSMPAAGSNPTIEDPDSLAVTAHPYNDEEVSDKPATWSGYRRNAAWNDTNDDGYYVDIPIWIRTTGSDVVNLKAIGIVKAGPNSSGTVASGSSGGAPSGTETEPLYRATRVALLKDEDMTPMGYASGTPTTYESILSLKDADNFDDYNSSGSEVILDSINYTTRTQGTDRADLYGVSNTSGTEGIYSEYDPYDPDGSDNTIITLDGSNASTKQKKFWIRVWLDGEDLGCWNANAGQDWTISLKFIKIT